MSWFEAFRARVTPVEFFARFVPEFSGTRARKYRCMFHDEQEPSLSIDPDHGTFRCFGCQAHGGMLEFFARLQGLDLKAPGEKQRCVELLLAEFGVDDVGVGVTAEPMDDAALVVGSQHLGQVLAEARAHQGAVSPEMRHVAEAAESEPIDESVVEQLAKALWSPLGDRAHQFLRDRRGLTEETLRRFQIGWHAERGRIAFPVRDAAGRVMNIRLYSPVAPDKMQAWATGYGGSRLYPQQILAESDHVVLAEGEVDALTAIQIGIPAVTVGSATVDWHKNRHLARTFRGKNVTIVYDRADWEPGVAAARKIAPVLLEEGAAGVRIMEWTDDALAACGGEKADINDYLAKARRSRQEFQALLEQATPFVVQRAVDPDAPARPPFKPGDRAEATGTRGGDDPRGEANVLGAASSLGDDLWSHYFTVRDAGAARRTGVPIREKAAVVVDHLARKDARFFYFESIAEVVFVVDGRWHTVESESEAFSNFWHRDMGLFGMETPSGRELIEAVTVQIRLRPDCVRVPRPTWGHMDWKRGTLYLCLDPLGASLVRVLPGQDGTPKIDELPNGTDEVLLRCPRSRARRFSYTRDDGTQAGLRAFRDLVHRSQALDEVARLGATAHKLAALFPGLAQRPLAFHQGGEHSGKTTAAQDFELVIYGEMRACGFDKVQELWSALDSAGPLVTQDNAESRARVKFGDTYNRLTTGVSHKCRKLYTNSVVVEYHANASLVLTAIESFSSPEDIDRAIEFCFDMKYQDKKNRAPRTEHIARIREQSDVMLSALLNVLSTAVLPDLESNLRKAHAFILANRPGHPKERFNEYLALMLLWFDAIGHALWDEARAGEPFDACKHFLGFLDGQRDLHFENAIAASREVQFLDALRLQMGVRSSFDSSSLQGVPMSRTPAGACTIGPVTTSALFSGFGIVAGALYQRLPWDNARQLGQRMAAAARPGGTLEKADWKREAGGGAHDNNPLYKFVYTPPIHAVPDGGYGVVESLCEAGVPAQAEMAMKEEGRRHFPITEAEIASCLGARGVRSTP